MVAEWLDSPPFVLHTLFLSVEFAALDLPLAVNSIARRSNIFWFQVSSNSTNTVSIRRRESGASSLRPKACGVSTFANHLSNISQK
jgi:hypothetical protein